MNATDKNNIFQLKIFCAKELFSKMTNKVCSKQMREKSSEIIFFPGN